MVSNTVSFQKFQNLLLFLARKRYSLIISKDVPWGHTSFVNKTVEINPFALKMPQPSDRKFIRHCPASPEQWEQAITMGLIAHEASHVRFSGLRPQEPTLGWLWNSLEDERIERLFIKLYPKYQKYRELLCDAAWFYSENSSDLLAGCLLWRWDQNRNFFERKFRPIRNIERLIWDKQIRPLVEKAWLAPDSDTVVEIARQILQILEEYSEQKLSPPKMIWQEGILHSKNNPHNLPPAPGNKQSSISSSHSRTHNNSSRNSIGQNSKNSKAHGNNSRSGHGKGKSQSNPVSSSPPPREVSPHAILAKVEGYARDLALALKPPSPKRFKRPHSNRGDFNLMRALEGHQRPFDFKQEAPISPSIAMLVLINRSGSMKGLPLKESIAATLLLDRAAEIADIPLGIWGFDDKSYIYRPLAKGRNEKAQRQIAGIFPGGGTFFSSILKEANQTLAQRQEQYKLLIIFHDGQLNANDTVLVKSEVSNLKRNRILLQPIYIGKNPRHIESNKQVFGRILACSDVTQVTPLLLSWLRALF